MSNEDCWEWPGRRLPTGYGRVGDHYAHRVMYEAVHGPIPRGMYVCHGCDNPPCFNPAHLWLGTVQDNTADATAKGRMASGERNAKAKLTADQVVAMREAYAAGGIGQEDLASRFGIGLGTANRVLRGLLWRTAGGPLAPHQKGWRTDEERRARKAEMDRRRRHRDENLVEGDPYAVELAQRTGKP